MDIFLASPVRLEINDGTSEGALGPVVWMTASLTDRTVGTLANYSSTRILARLLSDGTPLLGLFGLLQYYFVTVTMSSYGGALVSDINCVL